MIGVDATWRVGRRTTLQVQGALHDFWLNKRNQKQDPWAFTIAGYGALGEKLEWHAWYTKVSSLALRTPNPLENFTDQGVGIGPNFSDDDSLSAFLTIPASRFGLLTPELTFQRQGNARSTLPIPCPTPTATRSPRCSSWAPSSAPTASRSASPAVRGRSTSPPMAGSTTS